MGHRRELQLLVKNRTYIPFASLDASFLAFDGAGEAGLAYFQSEAMIELLVARFGPQSIAEGAQYLAGGWASNELWTYLTRGHLLDEHDVLSFVADTLP